jgi:RHS repeat-associated protein
LLDGLYVICEFSDSGDVLREYVPGVSVSIGGVSYFYHYDRLGSVRFMSDEGGEVVCEYVYDAFGNLVGSSGSVSQPYQYLSFYSEGEIGLYLTGKRWYAPDIGRYTDNPEEVDWSVPAIDSIDQCCKFHDWGVQHENNWWDRWVGECREDMCGCLRERVKECDIKQHKIVYWLMRLYFCILEEEPVNVY